MGAKAKKALKAKLKKVASASKVSEKKQIAAAATSTADFLPLEGGRGRKIPEEKPLESITAKPTVLYIGRIPHGFYETEMEAYFSQFGKIKRFRIARNRKTGKSKHYGFMEFEDPEVAEIVADCMHNYLLFEHLLQVYLIPQEKVHPKMWRGFSKYKPIDRVKIQRKRQNKERTLEDHKKLVQKIMKQSKKRQRTIAAAGLDYVCPDIVGQVVHAAKKIKFSEE
ncbi:MKI67 FHA domain-interacting nucleolar phosphoprotein [Linum grandiflorum]